MPSNSDNSKRIAKNTIILYIRMIFVMLVSLYTSRVVLQALGVDDFGLFNVVGGVVGLLTFFNRTMEKSTQRFLNIAMVKGNDGELGDIFASSVTVHLLIAGLFLLMGETIGLWFLNAKVNIPEGRELAANIVYQATLLSVCATFISLPYSAAVIAYEKMTFFAVVSLVEVILKLGIAWLLLMHEGDRLSLYGVLLLLTNILNAFMFFAYCKKKYPILKFRLSLNRENFKKIFGFVSWTLVGQFSVVGCNQGNVLLVNMFYSLAANAAMSVGNHVNNAIVSLTTNFQTAFNPQITKSYADGDYGYLKALVYSTSKISYCILFVVALPIAFNVDWILDLWLKEVPVLSNAFAILFMINGIINALSMPFNFTVLSSDNIRNFQLATATVFLADIPITYFLFSIGMPPTTVLWVKIAVITAILFVRIYYASKVVPTIDLLSYGRSTLLPLLIMTVLVIGLAFILNNIASTILLRILYSLVIELFCFVLIWFMCFKKSERETILKKINIKK